MDTEGKINEARFFLKKMKEKYNNRAEFKFYLSAFLSAGRSIIWIMNAEFNKVPFFKEWYDNRKLDDEQARVFKLINTLRVETNKVKPVRTRPIVTTIIEVPVDVDYKQYLNQLIEVKISAPDENGNQTLSFVDKTTGQTYVGQIHDYRIVNDIHEGQDLLELCENYLVIVEEIYSTWIEIIKDHLEGVNESDA